MLPIYDTIEIEHTFCGGIKLKMDERISYIKKFYPITSTKKVADHLNITPSAVRTLAKNNNINKSGDYLKKLKAELIVSRKRWYQSNISDFSPNINSRTSTLW